MPAKKSLSRKHKQKAARQADVQRVATDWEQTSQDIYLDMARFQGGGGDANLRKVSLHGVVGTGKVTKTCSPVPNMFVWSKIPL